MQLIPRYLVSNRINIIANEAGFVTEYRPVYSRQLRVYKGISNTLEFRLLNADQKPVDITPYTPVISVFSDESGLVISKNCTVLDDGVTANKKGLFTVVLTENELLNLDQQYLSYNIYLEDSNGHNTLTYSQAHFVNNGVIYLSGEMFPGPKVSKNVTTFIEVDDVWHSEAIYADPALNGNEALHTAAIYQSDYDGSLTVQATLENQVNEGTNWIDLEVIDNFSQQEPTAVNLTGVFNYIRFVASTNPANKIEKILIRN